jgi:hypothetical protein
MAAVAKVAKTFGRSHSVPKLLASFATDIFSLTARLRNILEITSRNQHACEPLGASRDDYPHFRLGPFTVLPGEAGISPVL